MLTARGTDEARRRRHGERGRGQVDIAGSTFTGNKAKKGGAIATSNDVEFGVNVTTVAGSTFTNKKKRNCDGLIVDLGGNSDSDGSCTTGAL